MIRHARRAFGALKTRSKITEIFDGTDGLCAERFGFKTAGGKTFSHLALRELPTRTTMLNMAYAQWLPAIECGVFVTTFGLVGRWSYGDPAVSTVGVVNAVNPFVAENRIRGEISYTLFGGNKYCYIQKNVQAVAPFAYKLYCGVFHSGRVFARDYDDPYLIRWSAFGTEDWTIEMDRGGYVRLNTRGGEVVGMASFGEKLMIIRRNAVCVMRALGDARHFSIEQSESYAVPEVAPFTSVICGGQLWFYTKDGLCSFNGNTVTLKPFPDYLKGYSAINALSVAGRYVYFNASRDGIACLIEYDVKEDCFTRVAGGGNFVFERKGVLHCLANNNVAELVPGLEGDGYFWKSVRIDLGTSDCKTLKRLIVDGEGDLVFEIDCDGRKRVVSGRSALSVGERAESFTFTVRGAGSLKRLAAEWEVNS